MKPRNNIRFSTTGGIDIPLEPEKGRGRKRRPRVKTDEDWEADTEPCGPPTEERVPYRGEWSDVT